MNREKVKTIVLAVGFIVFLVLPFVLGTYWVRILTSVFMFAGLASAWNIIGGYSGKIAFGNTAFFGIGAYTTGILMMDLHLNFFLGVLVGGLLAMIFAVVIGLPLLRLETHYFALSTLGVAEFVRGICQNLTITRGDRGITLPPDEDAHREDLSVLLLHNVCFYDYFHVGDLSHIQA